jgi:hypothetical protein
VVVVVVVEGAELRDVTEVETALHSSLAQALPPHTAPSRVHVRCAQRLDGVRAQEQAEAVRRLASLLSSQAVRCGTRSLRLTRVVF